MRVGGISPPVGDGCPDTSHLLAVSSPTVLTYPAAVPRPLFSSLRVCVRLPLAPPRPAPFPPFSPSPAPYPTSCSRCHHPPPSGACHLQVFRTAKGKQLPVYVDYKNGGSRILTILRRYRGADRVRLLFFC